MENKEDIKNHQAKNRFTELKKRVTQFFHRGGKSSMVGVHPQQYNLFMSSGWQKIL